MQFRTIVDISPSGIRTVSELPEEDVPIHIQHLKDIRSTHLVIIDDVVVNVGLFDLPTIQKHVKLETRSASPRKKGTKHV
jgi:hypothetical protein